MHIEINVSNNSCKFSKEKKGGDNQNAMQLMRNN